MSSTRQIERKSNTAVTVAEDYSEWLPSADRAPTHVDTPSTRVVQIRPMPERHENFRGGIYLFVLIVVVPMLIAAYYFIYIASNQYVASFRFAVTQSATPSLSLGGASTGTSGGGGSTPSSGMSSLLGGLGIPTMASTQNYIVVDYLGSRQVVEDLQKRIDLAKLYSRPSIDWLSRYDASQPTEKLIAYWKGMMSASYDPITGIATAEVRAFSPEDAKFIGDILVSLSEALVNRIDMRSKLDAVRFAENDVDRAEKRLTAARGALTDFRIKEGVIDPTVSIVQGNVQDTATVRASLIQLQTQLATMLNQKIAANSPLATVLMAQIQSTQDQLRSLELQVGKNRGQSAPLTSVMKRYEQLDLERQYASNLLMSTMGELDQARTAAGQQSLYLTPFVSPSLPKSSTYPTRVSDVLIVGLACLGIWLATVMILRAVQEYS